MKLTDSSQLFLTVEFSNCAFMFLSIPSKKVLVEGKTPASPSREGVPFTSGGGRDACNLFKMTESVVNHEKVL